MFICTSVCMSGCLAVCLSLTMPHGAVCLTVLHAVPRRLPSTQCYCEGAVFPTVPQSAVVLCHRVLCAVYHLVHGTVLHDNE